MTPRILGLGGSLRPESGSLVALEFALDCAERAGATTVLLSTRDLGLPLYEDRAHPAGDPQAVKRLLDEARRCDGLIICSPVYHATMSGSVKNLLDYLELLADDDPPWLEGKPVGLITVSGGRPRMDAIVSLEIACRALHAWTVPAAVSIHEDAFDAGALRDEGIKARLQRLAGSLVAAAEALRRSPLRP